MGTLNKIGAFHFSSTTAMFGSRQTCIRFLVSFSCFNYLFSELISSKKTFDRLTLTTYTGKKEKIND